MKRQMLIVDWIHVVAGIFILLSLVLGTWVNKYWYLFTAIIGLNLLQFGFTRFCPSGIILKKLGVKSE